MGVGPPRVGEVVNYISSFIAYAILLLVHLGLQITLLVLAAIIIIHPLILKAPDIVLIIAGIALIDILIARKL